MTAPPLPPGSRAIARQACRWRHGRDGQNDRAGRLPPRPPARGPGRSRAAGARRNGPRPTSACARWPRRVGVSANAVYHHFANKEALLAALAAEGFRRLGQAQLNPPPRGLRCRAGRGASRWAGAGPLRSANRAPPPCPPRAAPLHQAGLAYVRFAMAHPALFRLMYGGFTAGQNHPELVNASMDSLEASNAGREPAPAGWGRRQPRVTAGHAAAVEHRARPEQPGAGGGSWGYFGSEPGEIADAVLARAQALLAKG